MTTIKCKPILPRNAHAEIEIPTDRAFPVVMLDGAAPKAEPYTLKSGVTIYGIAVGEEGRNRWQSRIVVQLLAPPKPLPTTPNWDAPAPIRDAYEKARAEREEALTVRAARLAVTQSGAPKLVQVAAVPANSDGCILIGRLGIGFRGGNDWTGDVLALGHGDVKDTFAPMPGITLAEGWIAQGDAGAMGSGTQRIAFLPRGQVLRTYRTGRLYGAPGSIYHVWSGEKLISASWAERRDLASAGDDSFPVPGAWE